MKIKPLPNMVQIKIEEARAGALDVSSKESAIEFGEVIETGDNVTTLKKGDNVFFKSWAVDIITHQDKRYYFIDISTNGIIAVVK